MSESGLESAKRAAAYAAVDEWIRDGHVVGIGSGSTAEYAIARIAEKKLKVHCIPTSFPSRKLLIDYGLSVTSLDIHPAVDVAFDGCDDCDSKLNCLKGLGGAVMVFEKAVAYNAKVFLLLADYRKRSELLKKNVAVEVIPFAYKPVMQQIVKLGGKPVLRQAKMKAGPVVTDSSYFIIDADFGEIKDPDSLNRSILTIPGVVETGIFTDFVTKAYFGNEDGSVTTVDGKTSGL